MARICIIANNGAYGNASVLAEGFKNFTQVDVVFPFKDVKRIHEIKCVKEIPESDHYIVIGAVSLGRLPKEYYSKGVTMILTDSTYMNNHKKYNAIFKANNFIVWAMPDLAPLAKTENIYYQPFIMPKVDTRKTELICHSPFCEEKMKQKGTTFIVSICVKNNLPIKVITGKTWQETIEVKARYRFFIDQIYRGIGKSGLEAMLLDCAVLSGVKPEIDNLPPITWTDKMHLEKDLLELIFDRPSTDDVIKRQRKWADVNLNPEFVARKIFEKI
jgi:hypothetical protein